MDFEDFRPPVRFKLSALWAAVTFCYVYGDIVGLFQQGRLAEMNSGVMGPLGQVTPNLLLAIAAVMAIPGLMVFLSLVLPPALNRWINVALGLAFTAIMLVTMPGAARYYVFLGAVEVVLTLLVVHQAWTWPRQSASAP